MIPPNIKLVHEVTGKPWPTELKFDAGFWESAGELARDSIIENVVNARRGDGSPQKANRPATRQRKRKRGATRGGVVLPLIDVKWRFIKPSMYNIITDKASVLVHPEDLRVSRFVQEKGYTGWMTPGRSFRKKLIELINLRIKRAQKKAAAYRKREILVK